VAGASGSASVAITLQDQASGPANNAAGALETLRDKIQSDVQELRNMQNAMRQLQGNTTEGAAAIKSLGEQITAKKSAIGAGQAEFVKLGGSFEKVVAPSEAAADSLGEFMNVAKGGLGPLGGLFERFNLLKVGGPAAVFIAATVALVGLGAAIVSVTIEMAKFSLAMADAGLKQRLAFGSVASTAGVKELESLVSKVSSQVPIASSEVAKLAQKEYEAGKRGAELEKAVVGASMAAAGLGKNAKLGGDAAVKAMLPIDTQIMKAKENWGKLFAGVNVEAFERALKTVLDLLDENTSAGKGLKTLFETMMNPLFEGIAQTAPFFKAFFKEIIIIALMVAVSVLKIRNSLQETFGGGVLGDIDAVAAGILAAKVVIGAIVVVVVATVAAFLGLAGALGGVVIVPIIAVVAAITALGFAFKSAWNYISSIEWGTIAGNLIDGLVSGIVSGTGAVLSAIKNLASSMTNSFKSALGIASPSRLFRAEALHVPEGAAGGIEDGTPMVEDAVSKMVKVPAMSGPEVGTGQAKGGVSGGGQMVFAPVINVASSGNSGEDIAEAVRKTVLELWLEMSRSTGMVPA